MKVTGLNGKGKGKLGAEVYSINHGVQIRREYNAEISNPSTDAQVGQRSRFKLASQVSAALAPVIVIPRKGLQSPRNLFTKKNMPYFYGTVDGAAVTYENLQITDGSIGLPRVGVVRGDNNIVAFTIDGFVDTLVDRLVFCLFTKTDEGQLRFLKSFVFSPNKGGSSTSLNLPYVTNYYVAAGTPLVGYGYGFRLNNDRARAKYSSYSVQSAEDMARLVANRTLGVADVTFTSTRGTSISGSQSSSPSVPTGKNAVYFSAIGAGSVIAVQEGADFTASPLIVDNGATVHLQAVPEPLTGNAKGKFVGWRENGSQDILSTSIDFEFTVERDRDIVGVFVWENSSGSLE